MYTIPNELEQGHPLNKHSRDYLSFHHDKVTKLNIFEFDKSSSTLMLTGDCIHC